SDYGVTFGGYLYAPEDGSYELGVVGADGWRLTVDGRTIHSVNYIGSPVASAQRKSNFVMLNRGLHSLGIEVFGVVGGAPHGLSLYWKRPSGSVRETVPSTYFSSQGPCGPGENLCGTSCAVLGTSNTHCGQCNNPCGSGTQCVAGACTPMLQGISGR